MFQIIFNELSAAEMSALPKTLQLDLLAEFQILPEDLDRLDSSRFGLLERDGKRLFRYRAKDYRIYFEKRAEGITACKWMPFEEAETLISYANARLVLHRAPVGADGIEHELDAKPAQNVPGTAERTSRR